jgi:hypothetical protein
LRDEVAKCDVLLAVIGPKWLDVSDEHGNRRLDDPEDFLRIEIATALQRNIPVIPILVDGAKVPKSDRLPQDLKDLAQRNGLEIRHASFRGDVDKLIQGLRARPKQTTRPSQPGRSTPQRTEEAASREAEGHSPALRESIYAGAGIGVGILAVVLFVLLVEAVFPSFNDPLYAFLITSGPLGALMGTILYNRKRLLEISGWIAYSLLGCIAAFLTLWALTLTIAILHRTVPRGAPLIAETGWGIIIAGAILSVGSVIWLGVLRLKRVREAQIAVSPEGQ